MSAATVFKVGDRVRIASLGIYLESKSQGLVVGNTGTVLDAYAGGYSVRTDNAETEEHALSSFGDGWDFIASELEPLS